MLRRRGSWGAALGIRRPRCTRLTASSPIEAFQPQLTSSNTTTTTTNQCTTTDKSIKRAVSFCSSSHSAPQAQLKVARLAALSEQVIEVRKHTFAASPMGMWPDEASFQSQVSSVQQALASRDAYHIFCAILRHDQHHGSQISLSPLGAANEVEALLCNAEAEAVSIATLLCACVAVTLCPADWPPWVAARFTSSGAASLPVSPKFASAIESRKETPTTLTEEIWSFSPSSPLHSLAAHTLRLLVRQLPRFTVPAETPLSLPSLRTASPVSSPLPLLRWLGQLCGVCLAPSSHVALRLAREVGKVSLDAAGVALKAHCDATTILAHNTDVTSCEPTVTATSATGKKRVLLEERWLALWTQLTQPSAVAPPTLPSFCLPAALSTGSAAHCLSAGIMPAELREARVSWHLHCLLTMKDAHHAARLLTGVFQDVTSTERSNNDVQTQYKNNGTDSTEHCQTALPVTHVVQAELLSSLPLPLLEESQLGERLTFSLLAGLRNTTGVTNGTSNVSSSLMPVPLSLPWAFVPAVSTHSVVYSRMLRYVLTSTVHAQRERSYVQRLHDLTHLLSSANVHALAASFVPAGQPLTSVMVATKDVHREEHIQQVVSALRAVVEVLCEEPTPVSTPVAANLPLSSSKALKQEKEGNLVEVTGEPHAVPANTVVASVKRSRKTKQAGTHASIVEQQEYHQALNALGAVSWKWREAAMGDVDGAVQAAVHLLTSLLELCSNRRTSLPLRKSEPKWRRELRERTAVRAHKFELLLQELPHDELRAVLQTLLGNGYHCEGSQLGVSLLKGNQVDLRYYTLPLLGSLYLAVSTTTSSLLPTNTIRTKRTVPSNSSDHNEENTSTPPGSRISESNLWRQAVYKMYRRRFEIYGDADLNATSPSYATLQFKGQRSALTTAGVVRKDDEMRISLSSPSTLSSSTSTPKTTTALVYMPEDKLVEELVFASTAPTSASLKNGTAELANCLLNRRVVVAGCGVVVDVGIQCSSVHGGSVFGSWIRKGTATL